MVEIVVEVFEGGVHLGLDVRLQLLSQHPLALLAHREEVGEEDSTVVPDQTLHVPLVDLMG